MSEQIKADFARAQKFIKAEQYAQAITILKPHAAHPRIAALLADLEVKRKPSGGILKTVLWIVLVAVVATVTGVIAYTVGVQQTREEYEIPDTFEDTFVDSCTANTDLLISECAELIRHDWLYYQAGVIECYGLIQDVSDLTDVQFLQCIGDVGE